MASAGLPPLTGGTFDPTKGYSPSDPSSGFEPKDEGFAGVIVGKSGNDTLQLFCIDLHTNTYIGWDYQLGDWGTAAVPHVGFVARILNSYYPKVPEEPAGLDEADQAAAVQAAIWFFSDGYVLARGGQNTSERKLHDAVAAIVADVITAGPLVQPPPPSLSISPSTITGLTGHTVGPFSVASSVDAKVSATGASMYKDAAGTEPIHNDDAVSGGTQIWLKSANIGTATLTAVAQAEVPTGNVYLYAHGVNGGQKLILAKTATVQTTVSAQAEFQAFGSLEVDKTIAGEAAARRGAITIQRELRQGHPPARCRLHDPGRDGGERFDDLRRDPGRRAMHRHGDHRRDGHTEKVIVTVIGNGQPVTVPANGTVKAAITDTYDIPAPGSLIVHKTITGDGAGQVRGGSRSTSCATRPVTA